MPSMVVIDLPSASTPSTRQEQTSRPSTDDGAGAAVAGRAAFLAAGQAQHVAQHVEQGLLRLAQELDRLAVDRGRYVMLAHQ